MWGKSLWQLNYHHIYKEPCDDMCITVSQPVRNIGIAVFARLRHLNVITLGMLWSPVVQISELTYGLQSCKKKLVFLNAFGKEARIVPDMFSSQCSTSNAPNLATIA